MLASFVVLGPLRWLLAYSLRICGVSTCVAYDFDEKWIRNWGYWRSVQQYKTYVQVPEYAMCEITMVSMVIPCQD